MSAALFLIFKLAWNDGQGADLVNMLTGLAACSVLIWIRTFCLMPHKFLDPSRSIWSQSFVGSKCIAGDSQVMEATRNDDDVNKDNSSEKVSPSFGRQILSRFKEINTWQYTFFYCIL